jgi:bifunctional non-homologous end joining protein LigD
MFHQRAYAMKKHHATRLHYDLRLEWNGVLLSWALPAGPSCVAGEFREAIEMPDHKSKYLVFEGVHKTGPIMLWDYGTWQPHAESKDIESSLRKGVMRFTLHGEKLKGGWTLLRAHTTKSTLKPVWTLSKDTDAFAAACNSRCILQQHPNSITGKSMAEIVTAWNIPRDRHEHQLKLFDL